MEAAEVNELSLVEGELVVGIFQVHEGWWFGSKADGTSSGLFPAPYVTLVEAPPEPTTSAPPPPSPPPPPAAAVALYEYV